jgi:putative Holliday junction resolvase
MDEPIIFLGIDWGQRKIGLALGDSETKMALPYGVVKNWPAIEAVIKKEGVSQIVIGVPHHLSGKGGDYNEGWQALVEQAKRSGYPLYLVDERLSSQEANQLINYQPKVAAPEDAIAAMLILQTFLDNYAAHNH